MRESHSCRRCRNGAGSGLVDLREATSRPVGIVAGSAGHAECFATLRERHVSVCRHSVASALSGPSGLWYNVYGQVALARARVAGRG